MANPPFKTQINLWPPGECQAANSGSRGWCSAVPEFFAMVASVSRSTKAALCVGLLVGTSDDGRVIVGGNDPLRRAQHIDGYDLQLGSDVFGRDPAAGRGRAVSYTHLT